MLWGPSPKDRQEQKEEEKKEGMPIFYYPKIHFQTVTCQVLAATERRETILATQDFHINLDTSHSSHCGKKAKKI